MTNEQHQVAEWMKAFDQEVKEKPEMPSLEVRKLRAKLILEEAFEIVINGLGFLPSFMDKGTHEKWTFDPAFDEIGFESFSSIQGNLKDILDGCEDLKVVVEGTLAACGLILREDLGQYSGGEDPHFNEVMRSNWTKLWTQKEIEACLGTEESFDPSGIVAENKYEDEDGTTYELVRKNEERCWLVKNKDGKVIKSPSYSPPNFNL